jgi:YtkA-like
MHRFLAAAVILAALGSAAPASAHGDEGHLEVVNAVPNADGSAVTYTVELTYANDGDIVDGAAVTATVRQQGGGARPPVDLAGAGSGWYAGTIAFPGPGPWRVTFATAEPEATVEASYQVPEPTPSTTTTVATTTPPPTTEDEEAALLADDGGSTDDGPPTGMVVGLTVAGALLIGTAVFLVIRRRPA